MPENLTTKFQFQPFDFSSSEKRLNFIKELDKGKYWSDELPNLKWITHSEFVSHGFFVYSDWHLFTRKIGGNSGNKILPEDWDHGTKQGWYAKCFIICSMGGYVMLPDPHYQPSKRKDFPFFGWKGKLHIAKFRFCEHDMDRKVLSKNLNRYTCKKCGFMEDLDSSG